MNYELIINKKKIHRLSTVLLKLTKDGIIHYLRPAGLSESYSQLIVLIFIFSQYFLQQSLSGEKGFSQLIMLI